MERTAIDDVESAESGDRVVRRSLTDALGATALAVNHYRIPPGEGFPSGLHAHGDQEELFVVLGGEATFETLVPRDDGDGENEVDEREDAETGEGGTAEYEAGEVTVDAGEAIRFAPGEYQSGRNAVSAPRADGSEGERSESSGGETTLVALALGAPRDSGDVRIPLACPECGHDYLRPESGEGGVRLVCPDCDAENEPEGCPECGSEMRVALGETGSGASPDGETAANPETVVVCPDCGAEAATPFRS